MTVTSRVGKVLHWGVANATLEEVFIRFARQIGAKQWFRKCFPSPARTRKLESYGYQDLCLSCGKSVSMTSYSNLRMPLPTLYVRDVFTVPGALAGPSKARKIISVVFVVRGCACCQSEVLFGGGGQLVAAWHSLF